MTTILQTIFLKVNTLRLRQNDCHFADDISKCIFFYENIWISIKISLKFVSKGPMSNIPALVQIMAWCQMGDKQLSETVMVSLLICVTRPQWVNSLWLSDTIWWHKSGSTLAQVIACCLTASSHYLYQCWLIISKVRWHPSESNFTRDTSAISHWN